MLCLLFICLPFADVVASLPYSLPVHLPCLSKVIFYVAPQIAVLFFRLGQKQKSQRFAAGV
ncbi:hypothetical protein KP22_08155 [Pectobacterium betavasculorum]|uniref:Uncharacterized protein n=1 Tax=Pectobacterium betavasculorum TaxID=55207 RepID=A0A093RRP4_9GAMM|nr:hypothetical protein KP22_08155 [Pectobacterium betavasculorum]